MLANIPSFDRDKEYLPLGDVMELEWTQGYFDVTHSYRYPNPIQSNETIPNVSSIPTRYIPVVDYMGWHQRSGDSAGCNGRFLTICIDTAAAGDQLVAFGLLCPNSKDATCSHWSRNEDLEAFHEHGPRREPWRIIYPDHGFRKLSDFQITYPLRNRPFNVGSVNMKEGRVVLYECEYSWDPNPTIWIVQY